MYANPSVMRYIPGGAWSAEQTEAAIARFQQRLCETGLGLYPVLLRGTETIIGHGGLTRLKDSGEIEVDYLFEEQYWNKGYATEICRAVIAHGFNEKHLERIIALAMPANGASIRVMIKAGMRDDGFSHHFGQVMVQYSITRDQSPE